MKAYHKRLLTVVSALVLLVALSSVFIAGAFSVDATQLSINPTGPARSADGLNRSSGTAPTDAEIDEDGYDTDMPKAFALTLEDEKSALYFNKKTAEVALQDKATGHIWFSNPQDRDSETQVEGTTRKRIGAQLTVSYYDQKGTYGQMDSFNDSIEEDGMTWEAGEDALTVNYRLGKTVVTLADVPQQISKSRMDFFLGKMSEADQKDLLKQYKLVSIAGRENDTKYVETQIKKYPNVVNEDTYYLAKDSSRILKKVKGYFDAAGYTYDDLIFDNEENQVEVEVERRVFFKVSLRYTLEDGALVVTLPGESIEFEEKTPPCEIRILEYFGAGGRDERGYLLLPDGSGSLVYFNNGKTSETVYSLRMYGADTVSGTDSAYVADKKASLPVFGVKNGRAALLVTIDEGAAATTLGARVGGMLNSYNTVFITFNATAVDFMQISDSRQIYFEQAPYRGNITLRYRPMTEENNDYMGMARVYRADLMAKGIITEAAEQPYPVAADLVMAVPSREVVAGIPVDAMEAMTTYDQAAQIAQSLSALADQVWLRLEGWQQGGVRQGPQSAIRAEKTLGGRDGLNALIAESAEKGWLLLPETWLETDLDGKGLTAAWDSIRDLCRDVAVRYDYDYLSRYRRYNGHAIYQLTAEKFTKQAAKFGTDAKAVALTSAAIPDLGADLWSDFTADKAMHRVLMQQAQMEALASLDEGLTLALRNPNAYALPYASALYDLPCTDSSFRMTDEAVPFYPAVVHGSIPYVCEPINYQDDVRLAFLNAVEFGAGLQYTLTWQTTALLKDTDASWINRGRYADWEETIADQTARARAALAPVSGLAMTDHERVSFNVYRTTYENGMSVVVNYTDGPALVDGVTIPAMDFVLVTGGDS